MRFRYLLNKRCTLTFIIGLLLFLTNSGFVEAQLGLNSQGCYINIKAGTTLNVDGNINLGTSGLFTNSGEIEIKGDWSNSSGASGFSSTTTGAVKFSGNTQNLGGTSSSVFNDFKLIQTGTSPTLTLQKASSVAGAFIFTSGYLISTSTYLLTFNNGSSTSGSGNNSFIKGPAQKIGNSVFTFPLGGNALYHPLSITAPSSTTDAYTSQYFSSNQTLGSALQTDSIESVSTCEYWSLTRDNGTSTVTPSLGWNSNSCNVSDPNGLTVAYWDSGPWTTLGTSNVSVSGSTGTVTALDPITSASVGLLIAIREFKAYAGRNKSICSGTSAVLDGNVTGTGAPFTYSWSPSTGLSSTTVLQPTASPTTTTTYTLTVTDAASRVRTDDVTVIVNAAPSISVSPSSATIISGHSVSLTASGAFTYVWSPSTGLSSTTGAIVTANPTTSTTYTVTGRSFGDNGCFDSTTVAVNVARSSCLRLNLASGDICIQTPVVFQATAGDCTGIVTMDFGDGFSVTDTLSESHSANVSHLYSAIGSYSGIVTTTNYLGTVVSVDTVQINMISCPEDCNTCIPSFSPNVLKKYEISAWVRQGNQASYNPETTTYTSPKITVFSSLDPGTYTISFVPSGPIIDGWQKIDGEFTLPDVATNINIKLESTSSGIDCFFDDIRVFPFDGSMKSYVYNPVNMRLVAELDERNYATFYEYDEEGKLVRVKKETERGIMTIKENRNNTSK